MKVSYFPFTPDVEVLLRHRELLNAEIHSIISFKEDSARLNTLEHETGVLCTTNINEGLEGADAVVLLNDMEMRWDKYFECIDRALDLGIPAYSSYKIMNKMDIPINDNRLHQLDNVYRMKTIYPDKRLLEVELPIITVMGLGENCGKFECQLEFKKELERLGYHAEWLCSNPLGRFAGMNTFPEFMFDNTIAFPEKVIRFNQYVYDLCYDHNADLLIIGVPGGITPLSEKDTNFFEEIPLIVSTALKIDYGILCFYYLMNVQDEFLDRIQQHFVGRYNIPVPLFYMSRQMLTFEQEGTRMKPLFFSDEFISKHKSEILTQRGVMTPFTDNSHLFRLLIQKMQDNPEAI